MSFIDHKTINSLLIRILIIRRLIILQWFDTTSIQEIHRDTFITTTIGGCQHTVEKRYQIDWSILKLGVWSQNPRYYDSDVRLGVVSNRCRVDNQSQKFELVFRRVFFQESGGVVIAY